MYKYLFITCLVLHTKSLLSSPQTLCAATTKTSTRKTNTMDSQILPNAVEYLLTPLRRLSSPDQFMAAAALAREEKEKPPAKKRKKQTRVFFLANKSYRHQKLLASLKVIFFYFKGLEVCSNFPKDSRCQ